MLVRKEKNSRFVCFANYRVLPWRHRSYLRLHLALFKTNHFAFLHDHEVYGAQRPILLHISFSEDLVPDTSVDSHVASCKLLGLVHDLTGKLDFK